jgi:hypothetical protein
VRHPIRAGHTTIHLRAWILGGRRHSPSRRNHNWPSRSHGTRALFALGVHTARRERPGPQHLQGLAVATPKGVPLWAAHRWHAVQSVFGYQEGLDDPGSGPAPSERGHRRYPGCIGHQELDEMLTHPLVGTFSERRALLCCHDGLPVTSSAGSLAWDSPLSCRIRSGVSVRAFSGCSIVA